MNNSQGTQLHSWRSADAPSRERVDYYLETIRSSLVPIYVRGVAPEAFDFDIAAAQLGPVTVMRQNGAAHRCGRGRSELATSGAQSFNLMMGIDCVHGFKHRGDLGMRPGDITLHYSEYPFEASFNTNFSYANISLPVDWVRTWMPTPHAFVGRRIAADSGWGRALSTFIALLSPQYVASAPLAPGVLADQLGSLLCLAASEQSGTSPVATRSQRSVVEKIDDIIAQRCQEKTLTVDVVAESVGISVRTVHRALAASGQTFGSKLIGARVECAVRMLRSPAFNRVTIAEIGRRAGFADASHFSRTVRSRLGLTPAELRAAGGGDSNLLHRENLLPEARGTGDTGDTGDAE